MRDPRRVQLLLLLLLLLALNCCCRLARERLHLPAQACVAHTAAVVSR
jgi:hypothetical protein